MSEKFSTVMQAGEAALKFDALNGSSTTNGAGDNHFEAQDKPDGGSQATNLIRLVQDSGCELFNDGEGHAFASIPTLTAIVETWPLRRKAFKNWIAQRYYATYRKAPGSQSVADALGVLEGMALFEGPRYPIATRLSGDYKQAYLDLGDEQWRMVHITARGWEIMPHGDRKFKRNPGMKPLPVPESGGDLKTLLQPFVNLSTEDDWTLFLGFLVAAIRVVGPQLILEVNGEQGSGKTTFLDIIKEIIDPNRASKRTQPKDERDLMIAAANNWLISLDNLSGLPPWLSDSLCRLSTGGALATRTLYSDDEETFFEARRPVLINGIGANATRPDLLDRSIAITLPRISDEQRKAERVFWQDFHTVSGKILGALCDAVAGAFQHIDTTMVPSLERMADVTLWVAAAESTLGWEPGTFQQAYRGNRAASNETALESSVLFEPLRDLLSAIPGQEWEGTAGHLLAALGEQAGDKKTRSKVWPQSPRGLRSALDRIKPNLRSVGISVEYPGRSSKGPLILLSLLDLDADQPTSHTQHAQSTRHHVDRVVHVGRSATQSNEEFDLC